MNNSPDISFACRRLLNGPLEQIMAVGRWAMLDGGSHSMMIRGQDMRTNIATVFNIDSRHARAHPELKGCTIANVCQFTNGQN